MAKSVRAAVLVAPGRYEVQEFPMPSLTSHLQREHPLDRPYQSPEYRIRTGAAPAGALRRSLSVRGVGDS